MDPSPIRPHPLQEANILSLSIVLFMDQLLATYPVSTSTRDLVSGS